MGVDENVAKRNEMGRTKNETRKEKCEEAETILTQGKTYKIRDFERDTRRGGT
jgi:hypothetical protein